MNDRKREIEGRVIRAGQRRKERRKREEGERNSTKPKKDGRDRK